MKKKLKIAMFFSSDASEHGGGIQEHIYYLANGLEKLGHRVDVYGTENNILPFNNYYEVAKSADLSSIKSRWGHITINNKKTLNLNKIIDQRKYNLVHIHEPYIPFVSWQMMKTNVLTVTTCHNAWDIDSDFNLLNDFIPFIKILKNFFSNKIKASIFVSKRTKECWKEVFDQETLKTIIGNGINLESFIYKKKQNKKIEILFLARIYPQKGLLFLVKALKTIIIKHTNVRLSVVGNGIQKKEIVNYVKKNNLSKYVKFFGYIKNERKPDFFQKADIFCAPYINEGFGITLLEAMACGTPIVGFRNDAFAEVLKDYPYKELIIKEKTVKHLAVALEKIILNPKIRKEITQWELKEVKKYDWKKIALETEKFYYKVLNK